MSDLEIDTQTNDLAIKDGDFSFVTDKAGEAMQAIRMTLQTFQGEWPWDLSFGLPYHALILGQKPSNAIVVGLIREAIEDVDLVEKVRAIKSEFSPQTRQLVISFEATIKGGGTISNTIKTDVQL